MADSVDARRFRRTRLKRAMQPIIELLGCTQMGAADAIKGVFAKNNHLQAEVTRKDELLQSLREGTDKIIKDKDAVIDALKVDVDERGSEIKNFEMDIIGRDDKIVARDREIDRLKTAIAERDEKIAAQEETKLLLRQEVKARDAEIDRLKTARIDTEARQDEKIEALEENLNVTANELAVLKESKSIQEG